LAVRQLLRNVFWVGALAVGVWLMSRLERW